MSLVELPILTSQSVAGVKTAETQVRIILRDISGKFCWESTALYNSEDSTMSNDDGSIELPEWPPTEAYENTQPKSFSQVQALRYVHDFAFDVTPRVLQNMKKVQFLEEDKKCKNEFDLH